MLTGPSQGARECNNHLHFLASASAMTTAPHPSQKGGRRAPCPSLIVCASRLCEEINNSVFQYLHGQGVSHPSSILLAQWTEISKWISFTYNLGVQTAGVFFPTGSWSEQDHMGALQEENFSFLQHFGTPRWQFCWFSKPDILGAHLCVWCLGVWGLISVSHLGSGCLMWGTNPLDL